MDTNNQTKPRDSSFVRTPRNYISTGLHTAPYPLPEQRKRERQNSTSSILGKIRGFLSSLWSNGEKETDKEMSDESDKTQFSSQLSFQPSQQVNVTRLHFIPSTSPSQQLQSSSSSSSAAAASASSTPYRSPSLPPSSFQSSTFQQTASSQDSNLEDLNFDQLKEKLQKGGITQLEYDRITSLLRSKVISDASKSEQTPHSLLSSTSTSSHLQKTVTTPGPSPSPSSLPPNVRHPIPVQSPIKQIVDFGNLILDKTKPSRLQVRQQFEQRNRIPSFSETYKLSGSAFGLARPTVQTTPNVFTSTSNDWRVPSLPSQSQSPLNISRPSSVQSVPQTPRPHSSNLIGQRPMFPPYDLQNQDDLRQKLGTRKRGPPLDSVSESDEFSQVSKKRTLENRQTLPVTPYLHPTKSTVAMSATARKILATLNRIMSPTTDAAESLIDLESPFGTTVDITTRHKRLATRKQKKQEFLKAERPESEEFKMEPPPSEALITPPPKHKQKQVHLMDISRPSSEMKIKTQTPASVKDKQEFKSFDEEAESLSTTSGLRRKRKKSKSKSKSKSELKQERNIQTTVRKIDKYQKELEDNESENVIEINSDDDFKAQHSGEEEEPQPQRKKPKVTSDTGTHLDSRKSTSQNVVSTSSILKLVPDLTKAKATESQRTRVASAFDEELDKAKTTIQMTTTPPTRKEEKPPSNVSAVEPPSKSSQDFMTASPIFSFSSNNLEKKVSSPPTITFDFNKKNEASLSTEEETMKEESKKVSTTSISRTEEKIEKPRDDKQGPKDKETAKQKLGKKSPPSNFKNYFEILGSQQDDEENEFSTEKQPTKEVKEGKISTRETSSETKPFIFGMPQTATTSKIIENVSKEPVTLKFTTEDMNQKQERKQEQEIKIQPQTQTHPPPSEKDQEKPTTKTEEKEKEKKEPSTGFVFTAPLSQTEEKYHIEKPSTDNKTFALPTTPFKIDVFAKPITENTYPTTFNFGLPTTTTVSSETPQVSDISSRKEESKSSPESSKPVEKKESTKEKTTELGFPAGAFSFLPIKENGTNLTTTSLFNTEQQQKEPEKKKGEDSKPLFSFSSSTSETNGKPTSSMFETSQSPILTTGFAFTSSATSSSSVSTTTGRSEGTTSDKSLPNKLGTDSKTTAPLASGNGGSSTTTASSKPPDSISTFTSPTTTTTTSAPTASTSNNGMDEETMASEEALTTVNTQSTSNNTGINPPKFEIPVSSTGFPFDFGSDTKSFTSSATATSTSSSSSSSSTTASSTTMFIFGANSKSTPATSSTTTTSSSSSSSTPSLIPTSTPTLSSSSMFQFGVPSSTSGFGSSGTSFSGFGNNNFGFSSPFGGETSTPNSTSGFNFTPITSSSTSSSSSLTTTTTTSSSSSSATNIGFTFGSSGSSGFGGGTTASTVPAMTTPFTTSIPIQSNGGGSGGFGQNPNPFSSSVFGSQTTPSNSGSFNTSLSSSTGFTGFGITNNTSSGFENSFAGGSTNPQTGGFITNFSPTPTGSGGSDFAVNTGAFSLGVQTASAEELKKRKLLKAKTRRNR